MKLSAVILIVTLACAAVFAQNSKQPPAADDYSGMYTFLAEGEFLQLNIETGGSVTGIVSRYGNAPSDHGAFLDHYIKKGNFTGNRLDWTSEPVHGVWYEFKGTIGRGDGKTPNDDGFYAMHGTLTEFTSDNTKKVSSRSRDVTFKSFPQDVEGESPRRD